MRFSGKFSSPLLSEGAGVPHLTFCVLTHPNIHLACPHPLSVPRFLAVSSTGTGLVPSPSPRAWYLVGAQ